MKRGSACCNFPELVFDEGQVVGVLGPEQRQLGRRLIQLSRDALASCRSYCFWRRVLVFLLLVALVLWACCLAWSGDDPTGPIGPTRTSMSAVEALLRKGDPTTVFFVAAAFALGAFVFHTCMERTEQVGWDLREYDPIDVTQSTVENIERRLGAGDPLKVLPWFK